MPQSPSREELLTLLAAATLSFCACAPNLTFNDSVGSGTRVPIGGQPPPGGGVSGGSGPIGSGATGGGPLQLSPVGSHPGAADGTLAQSNDGAFLYAVSADDDQLVVVDPGGASCANTQQTCIVASVTVGRSPARVVVGVDDTVYVSNRKDRTLSVIPRPAAGGAWREAKRLATGAEPLGLSLSADGRTLFVACYGSGQVLAFDVQSSSVLWQALVGDFPRSVAALPDGRLYVSHYRSGLVDVLDGATGTLLKSISANVGALAALTQSTSLEGRVSTPTFRAVGLDSLVVSRDGQRVYLPHRRERSGLISDHNFVPIVAPALTTVETATDLADDDAAPSGGYGYPPTILFPENRLSVIQQALDAGGPPPDGGGVTPICFSTDAGAEFCLGGGGDSGVNSQGGSSYGGMVAGPGWSQGSIAAVEDSQGAYLFIVNQNSGDVVVVPTHTRNSPLAPGGLAAFASVGNGPSGVVLSVDNTELYVHNAIDHTITALTANPAAFLDGSGVGNTVFGTLQTAGVFTGIGSPAGLGTAVTNGRHLFYTASDAAMSAPGAGVACESCHLEGGTDGNVWQFIHGPRKTMGLLGKNVQDTVPYHWDGTESDLHTLLHDTITARMGGAGTSLSEDGEINAYLAQLLPYDNPNQLAAGLTTQQVHGQALFARSCATCHSGADLTDEGFHDVGTRVTVNPNGNPDDPCRLGLGAVPGQSCLTDGVLPSFPNPANHGGFNTPTALGLYFAGPYFHDGSATDLTQVVTRMLAGTNQPPLSSADSADLVAYLETL